eukprot:TRINITY_DN3897_c0_g1_i1.p1 TRINITY_DN3897_c0_g1~~TRINITY_DN3897_c0_g1_i1.p1  ORF type:complete len:403 (-),score=52.88 TRINITY_DN3897_c0_g1_i1:521-1729(-)
MAASFNIFSSPPQPLSSKTYFKPQIPKLPTPPPLHLCKKKNHQKNDIKRPQEEAEKSNANGKPKGKLVYRHKGHRTGKLGEEQGVILSEDGISYTVKGAPFEFRFSYSEKPQERPSAVRDPPLVPFAPPPIPRPWCGRGSLKKLDAILPLLDSKKESRLPYSAGPFLRTNDAEQVDWNPEEMLGEPLSEEEIQVMLERYGQGNSQVNLGRDGLTHNMLELIHSHWRRRPLCKIRCKGVPTVDMENLCHCLEEKTGGKIIRCRGGVVYMFRGRNYNPKTRPKFPVMLWKPVVPIYPTLIERAPAGLTVEEADSLRKQGRRLPELCKLAKNGVYLNLVEDVREAFRKSELVKVNCKGMKPSDYKRIGVKMQEKVPCILLSFDKGRILMWRGKDFTSQVSDEHNV